MTTTLSAITNANTFSVWKDRTNELVTHAGKAVTLGDSETNSGNMKLTGNLTFQNSANILTVNKISSSAADLTLDKNLVLDDGNIRMDGAGAVSLTFSLAGTNKWSIETDADHSDFLIKDIANSKQLKISGSAITGTGLTIDDGLLPATITSDITGNITSSGTSTFATVDINGGAIDGATIGANSAAAGTFTTATVATADINGGAIDGTTIGANSAAAGTFTTINASSTITGNVSGNVTGTSGGLTTAALKSVLEAVYPVGCIYITTSSDNPYSTLNVGSSTASWIAYAQGRAIVGADTTGIAITAGSRSASDIITLTLTVSGLLNSKHPISVGDIVTVSGIGGSPANTPNLSSVTVTAITDDTISYASTGATETFSGFTSAVVKQDAFTANDQGGSTGHKLTITEMPTHNHNHATGSGGGSTNATFFGGAFKGFSGMNNLSSEIDDPNGTNIKNKGGDGTHNNLQPYIATYVWKRVS